MHRKHRPLGRPVRAARLAALLFLALKAGNLSTISFSKTYSDHWHVRQHRRPQAAGAGQERGRGGRPRRRHQLRRQDLPGARDASTRSRYKFPKDSSLKILTSGLLGEQYIGLEAGGDDRTISPQATASPVRSRRSCWKT